MDREIINSIKDQLFNKKTKDYTNLTFFFLIFSIFTFFVIRPSLTTAFSRQSEEVSLKDTEAQYEQIVSRIPQIQSALEELRQDRPLINSSLPQTPQINTLVQEIRNGGEKAGMPIGRMSVSDVSLVGPSAPTLKSVLIDVESDTTYDKIIAFQQQINNQRRVKKIKAFEIIKEDFQSSTSGSLKVKMQIEGYYL